MRIVKPAAGKKKKPSSEFSFKKIHEERRKSISPVFFVLAIVAVLAGCGIIAANNGIFAASSGKVETKAAKPAPAQMTSSVSRRTNFDVEPPKWKDLDGASMGEWMKKNNVETQMMKERQERLHQHQAGRQAQQRI